VRIFYLTLSYNIAFVLNIFAGAWAVVDLLNYDERSIAGAGGFVLGPLVIISADAFPAVLRSLQVFGGGPNAIAFAFTTGVVTWLSVPVLLFFSAIPDVVVRTYQITEIDSRPVFVSTTTILFSTSLLIAMYLIKNCYSLWMHPHDSLFLKISRPRAIPLFSRPRLANTTSSHVVLLKGQVRVISQMKS